MIVTARVYFKCKLLNFYSLHNIIIWNIEGFFMSNFKCVFINVLVFVLDLARTIFLSFCVSSLFSCPLSSSLKQNAVPAGCLAAKC